MPCVEEGRFQERLRRSERALFEGLSFCVCQQTVEIPRLSKKIKMGCEFIVFWFGRCCHCILERVYMEPVQNLCKT